MNKDPGLRDQELELLGRVLIPGGELFGRGLVDGARGDPFFDGVGVIGDDRDADFDKLKCVLHDDDVVAFGMRLEMMPSAGLDLVLKLFKHVLVHELWDFGEVEAISHVRKSM